MTQVRQAMKWVMLIAGALTCTMFYAAIAPEASLRSNFGQSLEGPVAQIVVRNWGFLIGLTGLLLIYGALHEQARTLALLFASASKIGFMTLVLSLGQPFLAYQAGVAVVADGVMVLLFAAYLVAGFRSRG